MKKAIVFGGGGFVGSAVVEALLCHGVEVCAVVKPGFYKSSEGFRLKGSQACIIECDLRELSTLKEKLPWDEADVFYQFAWDGLSGPEMADYPLQVANIKWLLDSIVVASELGCKKFVGAGSISQDELSTPEGRAYQEDRHRLFRAAMQTCEYMGTSVAHDCGIDFIWAVISNIYGEGELAPRLLTSLIKNLSEGKSMPLSEGTQNYDFIYRADAAEAFCLIGMRGKPGRYNISGGNVRSLREYLSLVRDVVAPGTQLDFGARKAGGVALTASSFDIAALKEDTGFEPRVAFCEGVKRTLDWIVAEN